MTQSNFNTGLLLAPRKPEDYVFGGATKVSGTPLTDGQWHDYLPEGEVQHSVYFDTMGCVSFSALNALEILIRAKYGVSVNFSDRFTAKMSGTTTSGNYLNRVGDSIRKDGFVDEVEWPYPREQRDPVFDWDDFYTEIPQAVKDIALLNLEDALIQYEWVNESDLKNALKEAPIQVTVRAWYDENGDMIYENLTEQQNHAVVLIGYKEGEYWEIFDSYNSNGFIKKLEWDYNFGNFALKYNITVKNMSNTKKLKDKNSNTAGFFLPALSEDAYKSLANNFGLTVKLKPDGSVDWANEVMDGEFTLF